MLYVGIDDTDSRLGMCTTYLAAVLAERLGRFGIVGHPRLIRLNPNVKYKTRGNAALCIVLEHGPIGEVERIAAQAVEEYARLEDENTNPGLVVHEGEVPDEVKAFALRVVRDVVDIPEAVRLAEKYGMRVRPFKNGRGVIGALAAIGLDLYDFTYELLAYRLPGNCGKPRWLDPASVYRMDAATYPDTWDSVDVQNGVIVFSPHTPDPVLYGIRGNSPDALRKAQAMLVAEPVERSQVFITNQGTDMHLAEARVADAKNDRSYVLRGFVRDAPRVLRGGHVFFAMEQAGASVDCAAFEPTKGFREIVKGLVRGDEVRAYGSLRNDTLNLEKLEVVRLAALVRATPPKCPACGRNMESAGRGRGYRCRRCGARRRMPVFGLAERGIGPGLYEVPPSARRHLAKQIIRIRDGGRIVHPSR